ncbi:MAG: 5'/3'-nucleotidase SurE [Bacteroidetes bacterium GWA2_31_9]|nr:MAG: 5'/3'-nucleotidase SurE [Bacteroidetes bacterium GWA2_31_9]
MKTNNKPLILVTNDDGFDAKGIESLIEVSREFGEIVVIAPDVSRSGMSHAITIKEPLRITNISENDNLTIYSTNGTPVDCVKLAINQILPKLPDLILSGINHGSNASISVIYSGTMGAVMEGCIYGIPSIGFSILDYSKNADFTASKIYARHIIRNVLKNGINKGTCLNVNIPKGLPHELKGIKVCRQTKGMWKEEFDKRTDPHKCDYFWLTGYFENLEPENDDTDEWALANKYVSIVPTIIDFTDYVAVKSLKNLENEILVK